MWLHEGPGDQAVASLVRAVHEPPGALRFLFAIIEVEELHDHTRLRFGLPTIQVHAQGATSDDSESCCEVMMFIFAS